MTSPTEKIDFAAGVRMSQRMIAAWTVTRDEFKKEFPHADLHIIKGSFQSDFHPPDPNDPSAGYHDLSGALDIRTADLSEAERNGLIRIARSIGWAAWLRGPTLPGEFDLHAHLALLGEPEEVDGKPYVDDGLINQMKAYKTEGGGGCCGHGGNGLTGDSARDDPHSRPHPIPVFDYEAWENDMTPAQEAKLDELLKRTVVRDGDESIAIDVAVERLLKLVRQLPQP
jgi:hypothetical protein